MSSLALVTSSTEFWISVIAYALSIVGEWMLLEKVGEKGWKSLLPFYRTYLLYRIFWDRKVYFLYLALTVLLLILAIYTLMAVILAMAVLVMGYSIQEGQLVFCILLLLGLSIATLVVQWKLYRKISGSFGEGKLFTLGLLLFPGIFMLILGLDSRFAYPDPSEDSKGVPEIPKKEN